ncbi:hypothetical protein OROMI_027366 [Orobanche minor]
MEALGVLKFWRNTAVGADISSEVDDVRNSSIGTDDDEEESDNEESLFDLVIKSPEFGAAIKRDDDLKKESRFIESPRDFFLMRKKCFSSSKPESPVTILRPAPKFRAFVLGLRKSSKCGRTASSAEPKASPLNQPAKSSRFEHSNRFYLKRGPAESPVGPVFATDNSLRSKMLNESCDYKTNRPNVNSPEKSVPKYLKLIKPFYVKVSRKTKSTDSATPLSSPMTAPVSFSPMKFAEVSRVGSFKIMTRNFVKSRSASAAEGPVPPSIRRRDDSLLEQHDGIQGAILHCKKSYNSSSYQELSKLSRATSDSSHEKLRRNSCEEQNRCSI